MHLPPELNSQRLGENLEIPMSNPNIDLTSGVIPPRPSRSLEGRVAIVTGAGSRAHGIGNGRAAAILLTEAGASVVCVDMNLDWAKVTVDMILEEFGREDKPARAIALQIDVTKEDQCKHAVEYALQIYGRVDILVNNVGVGGPLGTAVDVDPAQWAKGLEVNVTSMMLMTKYAVPAMERNERHPIAGRGSIVNMASVAGLVGGTPMLLYPTSKGAVINMTRAMAVHHAPSGIRVNCVCPGEFFDSVHISPVLMIVKACYIPQCCSQAECPKKFEKPARTVACSRRKEMAGILDVQCAF